MRHPESHYMSLQLSCGHDLWVSICKCAKEIPKPDAHPLCDMLWGPKGVVGDARVNLAVTASASEPKPRCRNHALHSSDALLQCL
jgi:hypothetical protein